MDALLVLAFLMIHTSLYVLAYKLVAKKVCAILAPLDEEFHITRTLLDDLLAGLKPLHFHPPDFIPSVHFTHEYADNLDLDPTNWLWPDRVKLIHWIVLKHVMAFTWVPTKHGCLNKQYFPLVKIPTVSHSPWMLQNIPIPPSMWADTIQIIKDWNTSGIYSMRHQLLPIGHASSAFSSRMANLYTSYTTCNLLMQSQSMTHLHLHSLST